MSAADTDVRRSHHILGFTLGAIIASLLFLIALQWVQQKAISRLNDRIGHNEASIHDLQAQSEADATATRVLVLALIDDPKPSLEVVEVNVKKATAPQHLSPVFIGLLDELRKRSAAKANGHGAGQDGPRPTGKAASPKMRARTDRTRPEKRD